MLLLERPEGTVEAGTLLTLAEYLSLPEDTRAEIVDGVLRPMVRPNKRGRRVQRRLASLLERQLLRGLRVEEAEVVGFCRNTAGCPDSGCGSVPVRHRPAR